MAGKNVEKTNSSGKEKLGQKSSLSSRIAKFLGPKKKKSSDSNEDTEENKQTIEGNKDNVSEPVQESKMFDNTVGADSEGYSYTTLETRVPDYLCRTTSDPEEKERRIGMCERSADDRKVVKKAMVDQMRDDNAKSYYLL